MERSINKESRISVLDIIMQAKYQAQKDSQEDASEEDKLQSLAVLVVAGEVISMAHNSPMPLRDSELISEMHQRLDDYEKAVEKGRTVSPVSTDPFLINWERRRDALNSLIDQVKAVLDEEELEEVDAMVEEAMIDPRVDVDTLYSEKYPNVVDQYRDFDNDPDRNERELRGNQK